ncbi:hypothetical protein AJ87_48785 [Rhizobium yanglingense]|nr:hypothetical protein AJ87_48785 [Rhizobium yanglingense]
MSELARMTGLELDAQRLESDFERAFSSPYGEKVSATLRRQYRMAPEIGKLVSQVFYQGVGLETERGDPLHYYDALPKPFNEQFAWIDTATRSGKAEVKRGTSFSNPPEAQGIISLLETLGNQHEFLENAKRDLKEGEPLVGVICMYAPQRDLLQDMLHTSTISKDLKALIKIDTVDSYQGKKTKLSSFHLSEATVKNASDF